MKNEMNRSDRKQHQKLSKSSRPKQRRPERGEHLILPGADQQAHTRRATKACSEAPIARDPECAPLHRPAVIPRKPRTPIENIFEFDPTEEAELSIMPAIVRRPSSPAAGLDLGGMVKRAASGPASRGRDRRAAGDKKDRVGGRATQIPRPPEGPAAVQLPAAATPAKNQRPPKLQFKKFQRLNHKVDAHEGSKEDWLERHERACVEALRHSYRGVALIVPKLFTRASDERNLNCAWTHVAARSGSTAGPDGETIKSLKGDRFQHMRDLQDAIREDRYEHDQTRDVPVPKKHKSGTRLIQIPSILDRIVHRGIVQVFQPLVDGQFFKTSFGFRPRRDRRHALVFAETQFELGSTVVCTEDLKSAFDNVPQDRLVQILQRYASERRFVGLLEKVIRTPSRVGLRQGAGSSPLFLNIYCHHTIDRVWHKKQRPASFARYADDLALFARSRNEAAGARGQLQEICLAPGFCFRGSKGTSIVEVAQGQPLGWLGYQVRWVANHMEVRISESGWTALAEKVSDPAGIAGASERLSNLLRGWIQALGPAYDYENRRGVLDRLNGLLRDAGWNKKWKSSAFEARWQKAHEQWIQLRKLLRSSRT